MYFEFWDVITFLLLVGGGIGLIWYSNVDDVEKDYKKSLQRRVEDIRKRFGKKFSYPIEQYDGFHNALHLVMQTDAWEKLKDEKKDGLIIACVRLQDSHRKYKEDVSWRNTLSLSGWGLILFWALTELPELF